MAAKIGGSGGDKHTIEQTADINITPFIDILLVLMIIFMVAAPMATVSIRLDLPPAVPPPPGTPEKDPVYISIQEGGDLYIADKQTSLENLIADISDTMTAKGVTGNLMEERVFVRADADVSYEQFMAVLNVLQANGFYKIGLINEDIE